MATFADEFWIRPCGGAAKRQERAVAADETADVEFCGREPVDRALRGDAVDRAVVHARENADVLRAALVVGLVGGDVRVGEVQVLHDAGAADAAEQADIIQGRRCRRHREAVDRMALAVERADERRRLAADRREALRAPHAGVQTGDRRERRAEIDVVGERVFRGEVELHQLKLMRVGDRGRIFGTQERPRLAVDHVPGVGEVPAAVARLRAGLRGGETGTGRTTRLARCPDVPVRIGDDPAAESQPGYQSAGLIADDCARRIRLSDRPAQIIQCNKAARAPAAAGIGRAGRERTRMKLSRPDSNQPVRRPRRQGRSEAPAQPRRTE